ncbi:MAG: phosphoglycolate phosphatase [Candidatus Hydrogenedentota bacterium]
MIKAVVFDLDGTLIDSTDAIVESFFHTFDTLGEARPPRDAIVNSIGFVLEKQFAMMSTHPVDDCARIYREYYANICCPRTTLLPYATECLSALREAGLVMGVATSKRMTYAAKILDHLGILDYFDSRIGPDEVTNPKPDPEAVLKSMENLGVTAAETLFVGDMDFDVLAARAAGVECLCVTTGYMTREALEHLEPAAVYDSLRDVASHVLRRLPQPALEPGS